jgi:hypothetical protein
MAGDWSSLNGAVGGGCTSDGVGVPPAVSRGQEAGGRSGAHGVLVKEEEREKENGGGGIGWRFLYRHVEVGDGSAEGARGDMEWGGGGLAVHPGGTVGQQRPDRGGSTQAALARVDGAEQGRGRADRWAPL